MTSNIIIWLGFMVCFTLLMLAVPKPKRMYVKTKNGSYIKINHYK